MVVVTTSLGRIIAGLSISSCWVMSKSTCLNGTKHLSGHVSQPPGLRYLVHFYRSHHPLGTDID